MAHIIRDWNSLEITAAMVAAAYPTPQVYTDTSGVTVDGKNAKSRGWATGATITMQLVLPQHGRPRGAIIVCHGAGKTAEQYLLDGLTGSYPMRMADEGFAVIAADMGYSHCGNPIALTIIDQVRAAVLGELGTPAAKVGLWASSMGAHAALNWLQRNPTKVFGVMLTEPALNVDQPARADWDRPSFWDGETGDDEEETRAGYSAAYQVHDSGLPAPLNWSGSGLYNAAEWDLHVTQQGYNDMNRHPEIFRGLGVPIKVWQHEGTGPSGEGWVGAVSDQQVKYRLPRIGYNDGTVAAGHQILTWGSMNPTLNGPSGLNDDQIEAANGLAPREFSDYMRSTQEAIDTAQPGNIYYVQDYLYPIDKTGATNVTSLLRSWLKTIPDGTPDEPTIAQFELGGTYRHDNTLDLAGRKHLTIRGGTFDQVAVPAPMATRPMFNTIGGEHVTFKSCHLIGSMDGIPDGLYKEMHNGEMTPVHEWCHGIDVDGTSDFLVEDCTIEGVWGDAIKLTPGSGQAEVHPSGVIRRSTLSRIGRNAVAFTGCEDVMVGGMDPADGNTIEHVGYCVWDFEIQRATSGVRRVKLLHNDTSGNVGLAWLSVSSFGDELNDLEVGWNTMAEPSGGAPAPISMNNLSVPRRNVYIHDNELRATGVGMKIFEVENCRIEDNVVWAYNGTSESDTMIWAKNSTIHVSGNWGRNGSGGAFDYVLKPGAPGVQGISGYADGDPACGNALGGSSPSYVLPHICGQPPTEQPMPRYVHLPFVSEDGLTYYSAAQMLDIFEECRDAWGATGVAIYRGGQNPSYAQNDGMLTAIRNRYGATGGIDLVMMPANQNEAALPGVLNAFSADQKARTVICNGQEKEDNLFGENDEDGNYQPYPLSVRNQNYADYRAKSKRMSVIARAAGVRFGAELNSYIGFAPTKGGEAAWVAMVDPVDIDVVCWSIFQYPDGAEPVTYIEDAMDRLFPGIPYGGASIGWSVPIGSPDPGSARATQATRVSECLTPIHRTGTPWEHDSWYMEYRFSLNGVLNTFEVGTQLLPVLVATAP